MGGGEHLGVLLAYSRELVDVEETPPAAAHRVQIEVLLAQRRVGPEPVRVVGGHVVGHDVEHEPQAGSPAAAASAAELRPPRRGPPKDGRVDHVVAVGGAGPGLERRRQIEMRDPHVPQVGHELPHAAKPKSGVSCRR